MSKSVKLRDLVVLGLLKENTRYGYEIKMIIDNVMSHVIDVSVAVIQKLTVAASVRPGNVEREQMVVVEFNGILNGNVQLLKIGC